MTLAPRYSTHGDNRPSRRARFSSMLALLCAISTAGCVGSVGDPDENDIEDGGPTAESALTNITVHRLNRAEYDNTVRDLLGTAQTPGVDFPADDFSYGFDNIADTLNLSPNQFELYEIAADGLSTEVLTIGVSSDTERFEAETITGDVGVVSGNAWNLFSNGEVSFSQTFPSAGKYEIRVRAWQTAAGPDDARMSIRVGSQTFGPFDVTGTAASPQVVTQEVTLTAGAQVVAAAFLNDFNDQATGDDRNLLVDYIEIVGPIGGSGSTSLRDRIVTCDPATGEACVRQILGDFAELAWRRPVTDAEVDGLKSIYDLAEAQGDDADTGLTLAVRATLTHSNFLYRIEVDEDPNPTLPHPIDDHQLASRLSYFLWSSMPDGDLFEKARAKTLNDTDTLDAEVDRMLADPKSKALVDNFAGQWLYTRALLSHEASTTTYANFDDELRASMKIEADMFFEEFLKSDDLSLDKMMTADFTFVNDRLAEHYGLPLPMSSTVKRVELSGTERGGLLKQGSLLTVTSNPDRPSAVKRGKWVLSNLLCTQPKDPPKDVDGFKQEEIEAQTMRELLEQHRSNPVCASCHTLMDPIGLALENYDGIGAFRTMDKGILIDPSGTLDSGETFKDGDEMARLIAADPRFAECATKKMFIYALGRGISDADKATIAGITEEFRDGGLRLKELVKLIAKSAPFRMRQLPKGGAQ